jgi:hypothetical protein
MMVATISDALPYRRLWYGEPDAASNAVSYPKFFSRSHDAVVRVYDETGNVIETHEHAGDFASSDSRLRGPGIKRGLTWSGVLRN